MSVLKIKDGEGNWVGVTAIKGDRGDAGVSPLINVNTNTSTSYKLRIITEDKDFITPNLKGQGGGSGNTSEELGTIANYKDFDGKNIPPYNMDMPPLACYEGGTTYVFDKEVTMLVYDGAIDENGNTDIDRYVSYTGIEITVPTQYTGELTDYLIYNPVPKKEWDTWENPNIVKFISSHDSRMYMDLTNVDEHGCIDEDQRWTHLPNLKLVNGDKYPKTPYKSGEAVILNKDKWNALKGVYEEEKGKYKIAVYNRADFPFILDELPQIREYDTELKEFTNPVTIPYTVGGENEVWNRTKAEYPAFRKGREYTLEGMYLTACDVDENGNPILADSNHLLMQYAAAEQKELAKENVPGAGYNRAYDMVIAQQDYIESHLSELGAKPVCAAMYVGLEPLKNYTIEATASDCAIIFSDNATRKHITKKKVTVYPVVEKTITVSKSNAHQIGSAMNGIGAGVSTGGNNYSNGTIITYEMVDKTGDPEAEIEVPCALSMPQVYIKKGDHYTFQVEDEDEMYGIWVCCWNEEDYQGIKIVEGIEPYSTLMEERMASGATKFNIKSYWTPVGDSISVDRNQIMQEFNVKLCDNTTETDYCRLLNSDTIKHYDLDVFSMTDHSHDIDKLKGLDSFVEELKVPKMQLGTSTMVDGESELEENTFYFVYEE